MDNIVKIKTSASFITLSAVLKLSDAVMSGGEAKEAVQSGLVSVNGEVCLQRGKKLRPGDTVQFGKINIAVCDEG